MLPPLDELIEQPALVNLRAQDLPWDELLYEYERALDDDIALLNGLSEDQIHFKPAPQSFSIAEVLTHASEADRLLWSWVRLLAASQLSTINPAALISGDGARNELTRDQARSEIGACRSVARDAIDTLPDPVDLAATTPHPHFGELTAKGWIHFMTLHHGMHLRQCEIVIDTPGFPAGDGRQSLTPEEYLWPRSRKTWLAGESAKKRTSVSAKKRVSGAKKAPEKKKPTGQKKQLGRKTTAKR